MRTIPYKLTKSVLEHDAPGFRWAAVRDGFGWRYVGVAAGGRTVKVMPYAVHCGPAEDDYATEWWVDEGCGSVPYAMWIIFWS